MTSKLRVVIGWHMHQPEYREPGSGPDGGTYILPWTYLHAIKDYSDMAAHLEAMPGAQAVVNFAPILLDQLADYATQISEALLHGKPLRDPLLAALVAPALPAAPADRARLMLDALRAHPQRLIARYSAYARLAARAQLLIERPEDIGEAWLSDLLVWYHLAWMGEAVKRSDAFVQQLILQERGYTLEQRRELLALIGGLTAGIVPRYRHLAESGRVELSVTPYDHPILPLLLDIGCAAEAMPGAALPTRLYPGGEARAHWHLAEGLASFERAFGFRPAGCWLGEGAVSADAVRLLPAYGLHWTASGQGVLGHSLGAVAPPFPAHPYRLSPEHPAIFFRDDDLSDRIGFQYSGWSAEDAVANLVGALEGRAACSAPGSVVTIFLDGENAWEHYPDNGWHFLSTLYSQLAEHPQLELSTFTAVLHERTVELELPRLVPGSWVYGTLSTWIGTADKNRGWDLLINAKLAFDQAVALGRLKGATLAAAERQLGVCEGSDWFWWLGDYNPAGAVADFESLFRRHLKALYTLMGEPSPAALDEVLSRGQGDPATGGVMRRSSDAAPHKATGPVDLFHRRRGGVLAHLSSLPGPLGHGDLSHGAWRFVEFAAACGFTVWQLLPLGPTDDSGSPYGSRSAHAGNPMFISLDWLVDRGWLDAVETAPMSRMEAAGYRRRSLSNGHEGFRREASPVWRARLERFAAEHASWLDDYALFVALDAEHGGASWTAWPAALRDRDPAALHAAQQRLAPAIAQVRFEQFLFFTQWAELRAYAHRHGIQLFGDVPIFVDHHSSDVWAHRAGFQLDALGRQAKVAGVPPDYFSEDGQRWGNPLYDWAQMQASAFAWWRDRLRTQLALFDLLRIDHFRGLEACWEIPATAATAREGSWVPTPGAELLEALRSEFGRLPFVAEDLGVITPEVEALRARFDLPGMRVLQFGFDGSPHNLHLPHNFEPRTVCYTGTHDNPTTREWFEAADSHTRSQVEALYARGNLDQPWPEIHAALASVARLAIIPMQDLLGLGAGNRMNTPGTVDRNWAWRFDWPQVPADLARKLRDLNWRWGR